MTDPIAMPGRPKDVLARGAVRPWHVIFILLVGYVVSAVASYKLTQGLDPDSRGWLIPALAGTMNALICLAFVVVVPEFRRALRLLYIGPMTKPGIDDLAWAFFAMLCWSFGVYLVGVLAPLMQLKPEWYALAGFHETTYPVTMRYLALTLACVLLAPLVEELMFRGFLMNLWIARWGAWVGVIASSIVFGLFHLQNAIFAGVLGFAFALVYLKYDSLWPGIAMHAAYNLLSFDPLFGHVVYVKSRTGIQDLSNWIPEMIITILFVPVAWQFWRRFRPAT
jgi:membrane protease YdiL (CAAX protease family)